MRKFSVKPAAPPVSEIDITPLVDVVLVLLIIFMVVTPLLEKDIQVRVPDEEQKNEEIIPDLNQLLVSVAKDGTISINTDIVSATDYVERMKRVLAAKPRGDRVVFFTADDETNYAKLVAALDGARQAGAEVLGMATEKVTAPVVNAPETGGGEAAPAPTP